MDTIAPNKWGDAAAITQKLQINTCTSSILYFRHTTHMSDVFFNIFGCNFITFIIPVKFTSRTHPVRYWFRLYWHRSSSIKICLCLSFDIQKRFLGFFFLNFLARGWCNDMQLFWCLNFGFCGFSIAKISEISVFFGLYLYFLLHNRHKVRLVSSCGCVSVRC